MKYLWFNKLVCLFFPIFILFIDINSVFAEKSVIPRPGPTPGPTDPEKIKNIGTYFSDTFIPFFTKSFVQISGLVAVVFMVIAGVQFLTAYGNEEKITNAKKAAIYSAVGFLITLLSYAIISILNSLQIIRS